MAAVIAAIGSAVSAIISAITGYATRRVEKTTSDTHRQVEDWVKNGNGDH